MKIIGSADDVVVRLDFDHHGSWQPGQHFHICFPSISIWQSHPFTPSSLPDPNSKIQHHTYLLRVRSGITAKLAAFGEGACVPAVLTGPYGKALPSFEARNILAVAGGTGVTFTLPIVMEASRQHTELTKNAVDFVWVMRKVQDLRWLEQEFVQLQRLLDDNLALRVKIFVTRQAGLEEEHRVIHNTDEKPGSDSSVGESDAEAQSLRDLVGACSSSRYSVAFLDGHHPSMREISSDFVERASNAGGGLELVGSGPEAMGGDLRDAVSRIETPERVGFCWDSRE